MGNFWYMLRTAAFVIVLTTALLFVFHMLFVQTP